MRLLDNGKDLVLGLGHKSDCSNTRQSRLKLVRVDYSVQTAAVQESLEDGVTLPAQPDALV